MLVPSRACENSGLTLPRLLGLDTRQIQAVARGAGRNHSMALRLWRTGYFEARLLACLVDDPEMVTERQLERWARDLDSWAICDGACQDLFSKTRFAWGKAFEWSRRPEAFVKRASFALVAKLAVHDRTAPDSKFIRFLGVIEREADDPRKYREKGRQLGAARDRKAKPLPELGRPQGGGPIHRQATPSARWIASDALRELRSNAVQQRCGPGIEVRRLRSHPDLYHLRWDAIARSSLIRRAWIDSL